MTLHEIAAAALDVDGISSVAIFVIDESGSDLRLAASAGLRGAPLESLIAAVRRPDHPITRAMTGTEPTFNVPPINPGGPLLRSHLPLQGRGVLAIAHDPVLPVDVQRHLEALATAGARALEADPAGGRSGT